MIRKARKLNPPFIKDADNDWWVAPYCTLSDFELTYELVSRGCPEEVEILFNGARLGGEAVFTVDQIERSYGIQDSSWSLARVLEEVGNWEYRS
jgi:hypothetical protein